MDILENAKEYVSRLFCENSDGHDFDHTIRVAKTAQKLADSYENADKNIIALAALLHDADDSKLFNTENNENARRFLSSQGVDDCTADKICNVINCVSFSKNRGTTPETIEGKIVQDADRLDALGAIGIARTFAYGGKKGRPMSSSVDHFYEKLLLLKDELNTPEAKQLAEQRHAFLLEFLKQLESETKGE